MGKRWAGVKFEELTKNFALRESSHDDQNAKQQSYTFVMIRYSTARGGGQSEKAGGREGRNGAHTRENEKATLTVNFFFPMKERPLFFKQLFSIPQETRIERRKR